MKDKRINFTLGYEALKLLGKGLYSNVWAALSELIANSIDAHAKRIDVLINMQDKAHSNIEILDNGDGMDVSDIESKYVVIGNNKREGASDADNLMGRKGVGKLAALFLSKKYEFVTKKKNNPPTAWCFDFDDKATNVPSLRLIDPPAFELGNFFNQYSQGTILRLFDVNLTNMAEEAINALALIMSNFFIYDNLPNVKVNFYTEGLGNKKLNYKKPIIMQKKVAFGNMIAIFGDKEFIKKLKKTKYSYELDYQDSFAQKNLVFDRKNIFFDSIPETKGKYEAVKDGKKIKIPYELKGWIGIHSTISEEEARKNDKNFTKNKFYNPNKLRLYIRNKLAVQDFTSYLKNTQQGINYIEGEISFDLLDDNNLEDITTSNRQDIDIHDPRVSLLVEIVKKIVNTLIQSRNTVTKQVNEANRERKDTIEIEAKRNAKKTIKTDLTSVGIPSSQINDILTIVTNKFKGDTNLKAKEIYKVFISHSRKDRRFSDFIYNLLLKRGAKHEDIFYTTNYVKGESNLSKEIKDNIAENNVLVLFLDTVNFNRSQYCLFEGGAFWATRSIEDCIHIHTGVKWIPDYINDRQKYHVPLNDSDDEVHTTLFELTPKKYSELCDVINLLISHINESGYHIDEKVKAIPKVNFSTELDLSKSNDKALELMDKDFVDCWKFYVQDGKTDRLPNGTLITKKQYIENYNAQVKKMQNS